MKKIAFCFLIYDSINCEELWNIFFKNVDINKYSIYIHYKTNKQLKYFEKYKLNNCIETKYEDQTIPKAYNVLFKQAYKDSNNYKFIIISGSCIPFKSFNFIYNKLTQDDKGYFNVCPKEQCFPNCEPLLDHISKKYISKSHNWFILNRKLVENLCINKDEILDTQFKNIYAPAEYYYITYINLLKLDNEIITTLNESNNSTTFTNWVGVNYKFPCYRSLKNYNSISSEEIEHLLHSECLFGRKFTRESIMCFINKTYIDAISSN
uniref:Core-2/I-Branching enzyme n=1 Tax=viral metagenome TaxID=1070528 RepID=A0A6C0ISH7_9ZZZZ